MEAVLAHDRAMAERKELARKQKERALAQMQNMQRRFLERNRQQMLDLDTSVEEVYALFTTPLYTRSLCPSNLMHIFIHSHICTHFLVHSFDGKSLLKFPHIYISLIYKHTLYTHSPTHSLTNSPTHTQ